MITALPILILFFAIALYPAWNRARKSNAWFAWDYGYPIYTILIWFLVSGIGNVASMSNMVIEIPISCLIVLTIVYIRVYILDQRVKRVRTISLITLVVTFIVPVIIRLLMPTLEE